MTRNEFDKKTLKEVELALNKFENAIPYYEGLLRDDKVLVKEIKGNHLEARNFQITLRRTEAQLKTLLYELDTLRAQINNEELDKFDMKTVVLRKSVLNILSGYKEVFKDIQHHLHVNDVKSATPSNDKIQKQLVIATDLNALKLQERESCLHNVKKVEDDIQDLHSAYGELNKMVHEQGDMTTQVENNVGDGQHNIDRGVRHILTAARLKASMYPVTGAVMGGVVGGPIGLLAGLKIGSVAAVCCGCIGYFGGRILNKHNVTKQEEINKENQLYLDNENNKQQDTENDTRNTSRDTKKTF